MILIFLVMVFGVLTYHQNGVCMKMYEPIVLVHGGAGDIVDSSVQGKIRGVKLAARIGYNKLTETGNALDAVEAAVRSMELDDYFNAGYGGVLNWNGNVIMDASIMYGADLRAGCVSLVKDISHPISLARRVMEQTRHNYLAGKGVMKFAFDQGFDILPAGALVTKAALKALEDFKNNLNNGTDQSIMREFGEPGTVGAVAIDRFGNIAAATSTGGVTGKMPGRIGDSPILGSGTYADNQCGGVSSTGNGENILRFNVAQKLLQHVVHKDWSAQEAAVAVLDEMLARLNGTAGVISIDANNEVGIYFTTDKMAWAYQKKDVIHYGIRPGEDFVTKV